MPGTFSPSPRVNDPDMHHATCATHVPWCMPGSLTSGFPWSRCPGKRSRHSRRMRNPRFYVSGKRPNESYKYVDLRQPQQITKTPNVEMYFKPFLTSLEMGYDKRSRSTCKIYKIYSQWTTNSWYMNVRYRGYAEKIILWLDVDIEACWITVKSLI